MLARRIARNQLIAETFTKLPGSLGGYSR